MTTCLLSQQNTEGRHNANKITIIDTQQDLEVSKRFSQIIHQVHVLMPGVSLQSTQIQKNKSGSVTPPRQDITHNSLSEARS